MIHPNLKAARWLCSLVLLATASWTGDLGAVPKSAPVVSTDSAVQAGVKAAYAQFIAGNNAHDPSAVSDVLLNSPDFVWAQYAGNSVWGHDQAMADFREGWNGSWHLNPQLSELRIATVAPGVALLITPLLFTVGDPGEKPTTLPVRWGGVFVKTAAGWRIASIFITPFPSWHAH